MKLNEGEIHTFRVLKEESIPDQGQFFVLRHHSGRRLMLGAEHYRNYGIAPGDTIDCLVDRVNCTGRVFLEPLHPEYHIGKIYKFTCVNTRVDAQSETNLVTDCFGNRLEVGCKGFQPLPSGKVLLRVAGLKEGKPVLEVPIGSK